MSSSRSLQPQKTCTLLLRQILGCSGFPVFSLSLSCQLPIHFFLFLTGKGSKSTDHEQMSDLGSNHQLSFLQATPMSMRDALRASPSLVLRWGQETPLSCGDHGITSKHKHWLSHKDNYSGGSLPPLQLLLIQTRVRDEWLTVVGSFHSSP